jgi:hypothetical protein
MARHTIRDTSSSFTLGSLAAAFDVDLVEKTPPPKIAASSFALLYDRPSANYPLCYMLAAIMRSQLHTLTMTSGSGLPPSVLRCMAVEVRKCEREMGTLSAKKGST